MKFPGVISLRNDLPICAMPNGGFLRAYWSVVLKARKMPWAVSGQVHGRAGVLQRADRGLEHEVELARVGQFAVRVVAGELRRGAPAAHVGVLRGSVAGFPQVVGAEATLAGAALHQRVAEAGEVARRLPCARVLDDRRVERHDVVALLDHRLPPRADHVVLQQDAVMAVVIRVGDPAVDLGSGEDQATPLA